MKNILPILCLLFLFSCSSDNDDLPPCIDDLLEDFKVDACPNSGDLTLWSFQGDEVYCFAIGNCVADSQALIYDESCNLLCTLGGISGEQNCQGVDWAQNARLIEILYAH